MPVAAASEASPVPRGSGPASAPVNPPPVPVATFPDKPEVTITATGEAPIFEWGTYLGYVRQRKPMLGALLAEGSLSRFDGSTLEIAAAGKASRPTQISAVGALQRLLDGVAAATTTGSVSALVS